MKSHQIMRTTLRKNRKEVTVSTIFLSAYNPPIYEIAILTDEGVEEQERFVEEARATDFHLYTVRSIIDGTCDSYLLEETE